MWTDAVLDDEMTAIEANVDAIAEQGQHALARNEWSMRVGIVARRDLRYGERSCHWS
jgi:hypothetical protein